MSNLTMATLGAWWDTATPRERDAAVAEHVLGLNVVCMDWPCGWPPESCELEASDLRPPIVAEWYARPGPVFATEDFPDNWPPTPDTFTYGDEVQRVRANVEPVPQYTTDIAAAWLVVEHFSPTGSHCPNLNLKQVWSGGRAQKPAWTCQLGGGWEQGDTAPEAICLAALRAVLSMNEAGQNGGSDA